MNRAEPGDTITLTIEATEPLDYLEETDVSMSGTRVSISSVTESNEGRTWVATGTVQDTSDSDEELSYSIVSFQDEAGNSGTPPTVSESNMADRILDYLEETDPIFIDTIAQDTNHQCECASYCLSKSDTTSDVSESESRRAW